MSLQAIIFIHRGQSDYLADSLSAARLSNPGCRVICVSDVPPPAIPGVEHRALADFWHGADEFAKLYYHFSSYTEEIERFWFQRWFVLRDVLRAEGITRCFYPDSDVLIFSDLSPTVVKFADCDFTLSRGHSPHSVIVNSLEILNALCDYITQVFSTPNRVLIEAVLQDTALQQLKLKNLVMPITDMRVLKSFAEREDLIVGDTSLVRDGITIDHNINNSCGFTMNGGTKKILWKDHQPHGFHTRLAHEVRFLTLHFQGGAKELLHHYYAQAFNP